MLKVLIPVDGSQNSRRAVEHVAKWARAGVAMQVDLVNVQIPVISGHAKMFISQDTLNDYYRDEGEKALRGMADSLKLLGVTVSEHLLVGHIAETLAQYAKLHGSDEVVMGTRGLGSVGNMLLGSVATKLIHLTDVPVTLVK